MDFSDFCGIIHTEVKYMSDSSYLQRQVNICSEKSIGMYYSGKRINTPNHTYGPEIRNHYLFVLVNNGEAILYTKNGEKHFNSHDMLVMCPGEKIFYKALTPWSIQWVGLYGNGVDDFAKQLGITGENPILKVRNYRGLENVMEKLYSSSDNRTYSSDMKKISLIYKFFAILFEEKGYEKNIDYVNDAVKVIDYNFCTDITVEKLALDFGLNPSYLTRIFTTKMKISPKKYILKKRMDYAKKLLKSTDAYVFEISNTVGFSDQLYFSRIFKKSEGMSPSEYRNNHS